MYKLEQIGWAVKYNASGIVRFILPALMTLLISSCGGDSSSGSGNVGDSQPVIEPVTKFDGEKITDIMLPLAFKIKGVGGSDINLEDIDVTVNGIDYKNKATLADGVLTLVPTRLSRWQKGSLYVSIKLTNTSGTTTTSASFSYTVAPVSQALPTALPAQGDAPLTVAFYPGVSSDSLIESYEWDFDGDGIYDISEPIGRIQTQVLDKPGNYTVTLKITDGSGKAFTGTTTVVVANAPPVVSAEANPTNGGIPLLVDFVVTASDNEGIASYDWDFDGDGSKDASSTSIGDASHQYTSSGVYQPILIVTDVNGASTRLQAPNLTVRAGPSGSPSVSGNVSRSEGKVTLAVSFTASATDPDSQVVTQIEWDFDSDGIFDSSTPYGKIVYHHYTEAGTYYARVRATFADGDTAEDVVRINVLQNLNLSLSTDTIDTSLNESTTIKTILGGTNTVSLVIEDSSGQNVRTLVSNLQRIHGLYNDIWDGRDDAGNLIPDGQYRAILLYNDSGGVKRFDLGLSTGQFESNLRMTYAKQFAPFSADPLEISYSLRRASEVTAYLGFLNAGTRRLFPLFLRNVQGRGSHQIFWNGENENGVLIHPPQGSTGFLIGAFSFTLPDNAIYVKNSAEVSRLAAAPPVFNPNSVTPIGTPMQSTLQFELGKTARIIHTINNAETGGIVFRKTYENLSSGIQRLYWDGKADDGVYVPVGRYRHGIYSIDVQGNRSPVLYTLQRVYY